MGVAVGSDLTPCEPSGGEIEGHERVGGCGGRVQITIPRRRVDPVCLEVDGRRRPDRAARGPEELDTDLIQADWLGRRADIAAPQYLAGPGVERGNQAAEGAERVACIIANTSSTEETGT